MKRLRAFKYELRPHGEQKRDMAQFSGHCRFVYNHALALQLRFYRRYKKHLGYVRLANRLPRWKKHFPFLSMAPSQALQQALKHLESAWENFFAKRADFPRFKKKGLYNKFRYPQGVKLDQGNSRVFLPKLGWLRYRNSRQVNGTVKNITVSQSAGKWFASIQTEHVVETPVHPSSSIVGIDVGITRLATLSDGTVYAPRNSYKQHESALRKAQRAMSRKVKFSNNWKKAKAKIQRLHVRISHVRQDALHKASHAISKNHALVCVEDLPVKNMSKSASGGVEHPGKNVRAKSGLNKAILDQGWGEFRRQLDYKLACNGGQLIAVAPKNTSRTCPSCGHVSADNRKTQARFVCVACGFAENADLVGAINVLAAGHAVLACGETVQ